MVAPERSGRADSGAYIVQPARGAPSGTKKPASMIEPASSASQNDHMLMRGNAMSCVSSGGLLGGPGLILLGRVHEDACPHPVVPHPAQLGAADLILARLGGLEPGHDVHAGHRVLLQAPLRHEEGVNHVLCRELDG